MGLDLGKLLKNAGTLGTTWMRDQRQAKKKKKKAGQLVEQNTTLAENLFNRDLGTSAMGGVQADPALVAAQQRALGQTEQVAREGYTDVDRMAMNQQLGDAARYEQAQRATLAEQARARGVTGSGIDIASQLAAQQSGADRAMQTASDMAIAGRERTYGANQDAAAMASGMRGQQFGEQAQVAGAQDQYGQWRAGQQSSDAGMLMNARLGQSQALQNAAAAQASSPNLDAAANAVANYYTAGQAGNIAGSTPAAAPAAPNAGYSAPSHEVTTHGRVAGGVGGPPSGTAGLAQAANVPAPPNPRLGAARPTNARRAAQQLMRRPAAPNPQPSASTASTNPYRRGIRG